ncbi:MAG: aminotransferase class I/II-fold pyridoxal phosphate-dependent enzyme [Acutalibacteraceae bacterium]|nr:aminotransferase class I/II-fold pyridoxal phosphate-dependent enzyme [Acutalibacteraceae bacterium]
MKKYSEMTREELTAEKDRLQARYDKYMKQDLSLNMARGKPSIEQEEASIEMLDIINSRSNLATEEKQDVLNYGNLMGLIEARRLFSEILGVPVEKIVIGGNSSLNMMFDYLMQCYAMGSGEAYEPWVVQGGCKFLCPSPGYDRHFGIAEYLGLELIPVPMTPTGPDMDIVEELAKDPKVKGMFCVPKYANPTGQSYSDETVKRLAKMETAPDFRVIWDNAYVIHDLTGRHDDVLDLLDECEKAGNPDRAVLFASTSKVTFPGAGIAVLAANKDNLDWILKRMDKQTIGADKINQLRHVRYFANGLEDVKAHMDKLAGIITPHFNVVLSTFERKLKPRDICTWTNPNGGYFISLDCMEGTATRVYNLCKECGVTLTTVGATWPYGKDPKDSNMRIAPTYPSLEELAIATDVLCIAIRLAALEKILED